MVGHFNVSPCDYVHSHSRVMLPPAEKSAWSLSEGFCVLRDEVEECVQRRKGQRARCNSTSIPLQQTQAETDRCYCAMHEIEVSICGPVLPM